MKLIASLHRCPHCQKLHKSGILSSCNNIFNKLSEFTVVIVILKSEKSKGPTLQQLFPLPSLMFNTEVLNNCMNTV